MNKNLPLKFVKILLLAAPIVLSLSFIKPDKSPKLFLYATFADSVKLQSGDTNLINGNNCVRLHIDTVNDDNLKKDMTDKMAPQPNNWYLYKGKYVLIHAKDQLFELTDYPTIKNFSITEFDMLKIGSWDQSSTSTSNCLTAMQKKTVKDCWKSIRSAGKSTPHEFLICRLKVINSITRRTLDLPGITFTISKR